REIWAISQERMVGNLRSDHRTASLLVGRHSSFGSRTRPQLLEIRVSERLDNGLWQSFRGCWGIRVSERLGNGLNIASPGQMHSVLGLGLHLKKSGRAQLAKMPV